MAQEIVGSNPTTHPRDAKPDLVPAFNYILIAPVAQGDRATDFESAGCAFESRRGRLERAREGSCLPAWSFVSVFYLSLPSLPSSSYQGYSERSSRSFRGEYSSCRRSSNPLVCRGLVNALTNAQPCQAPVWECRCGSMSIGDVAETLLANDVERHTTESVEGTANLSGMIPIFLIGHI